MICDPMGLQHIMQSQNYPKTQDIRLIAERVFGRGLLWATGKTLFELWRVAFRMDVSSRFRRNAPTTQESPQSGIFCSSAQAVRTVLSRGNDESKISVIFKGHFSYSYSLCNCK